MGDPAAAFADLLTVSETANEPPQDEGNSFNSPRNLAMEATYINHNFSQQCLRMVRAQEPLGTHFYFVSYCLWSICFVVGSGLVGLSRTEGVLSVTGIPSLGFEVRLPDLKPWIHHFLALWCQACFLSVKLEY